MRLIFDEEGLPAPAILEKMEEALGTALEMEGIPGDDIEVSLSFVTPEEIRQLNRDYRDVDRETDVLSFPQFEGKEDILAGLSMFGEIELGDVVISETQAARQAEEYGHSFEREMVYLFTHSILHLLGYDHMDEEEKSVMRKREEEIMERLGIPR